MNPAGPAPPAAPGRRRWGAASLATAFLAVALALAVCREGAACWRLPDECYAAVLVADGVEVALVGSEAGLRVLTVETGDGSAELRCLEHVAAAPQCAHYYVCKPLDSRQALSFDSETTALVEVRFTVQRDQPVTSAELRHSLPLLSAHLPVGKWATLPVTVRHWQTVSSGSPLCHGETGADPPARPPAPPATSGAGGSGPKRDG